MRGPWGSRIHRIAALEKKLLVIHDCSKKGG